MMIVNPISIKTIVKYFLGVVVFCFVIIMFGGWVSYAQDYCSLFPDSATCKKIEADRKATKEAAEKAEAERKKKAQDDIPNLNALKSYCDDYPGSSACDQYEAANLQMLRDAQWEYQWSNGEKYDNCIKKWYSKLYCDCKITKQGIYLNTEVPFVGAEDNPRCLVMSAAGSAPTTVLQSLTKILMTFVMIGGFGMIVWAWVMIASSGSSEERYKQWLWIIKWVAIAFALLWSLWVILRFINPNFFS